MVQKKLSCWKTVYQCEKCTFKYKEKPNICVQKNENCKNDKFLEVQMYSLDLILSYHAFINVIVGARRIGKTYAGTEFCVKRWEEENSKFAWVRRYKTEMKKALEAFTKFGYHFDQIGVFYWDKKIEIKLIRGKEKETEVKEKKYIGTIVTLTTASRIRGGEFNEYNTLVIDEYGDEASLSFKKEFILLNSLITSIIDEKKDGIVLAFSNNVNRFLPLYEHIGVKWDQEWSYNWKKSAVVHVVKNEKRTWQGASAKWLKSTEYYDYAVFNKPLDYDKQLIEKHKLEFYKPILCFKLNNLSLKLIEINQEKWVIDNCNTCNHDFFVIDDINKINFVKPINKKVQDNILYLYLNQFLLYTTPNIKNEIRIFVARNIHLLEK